MAGLGVLVTMDLMPETETAARPAVQELTAATVCKVNKDQLAQLETAGLPAWTERTAHMEVTATKASVAVQGPPVHLAAQATKDSTV